MHLGPTDDDAILRAGRWATGSAPPRPPDQELEPVDLEAVDLEPVDLEPDPVDLEPIALDSDPGDPRTPQPRAATRRTRTQAFALATVLVVLAAAAGFVTTLFVLDERDTPAGDAVSDGYILDELIVQPSDLTLGNEVVKQPNGNDAVNTPTLDLCNGDYSTEAARIARRQVAVWGIEGFSRFGTEAVTYRDTATSEQAFAEVKRVVASCPKGPVPNAAGTTSDTTLFNPPPDTGWRDTPGVDRLAYDIKQIYEDDTSNRSIVVYLRRGRALMGLYFPAPGAQPSVQGRTEIEDIVTVFADRLADLPRSAVADPPD